MLIRASEKFSRIFRCVRSDANPPTPGPLLAWHAHTFTVRGFGRFVIFSEEHSLFSFLVPMGNRRSLESVMQDFRFTVGRLLEYLRIHDLRVPEDLEFVRRDDRRVIGTQNELIFQASFVLERAAPPLTDALLMQIHDDMNECPLSYLGMDSPKGALWKAVRR